MAMSERIYKKYFRGIEEVMCLQVQDALRFHERLHFVINPETSRVPVSGLYDFYRMWKDSSSLEEFDVFMDDNDTFHVVSKTNGS